MRTAGSPAAINVNEDSANATAVTLGMSGLTYGPGGGSDESGQTLTYKVTAIPAHITLWLADGTTQVTANTTVTLAQLQGLKYKTVADANGSGNLTWTVQDSGGTGNGGVDTLTENLAITVNAVNDMPVRTAGTVGNLTVLEDSGFTSLGFGGVTYSPGGGADESGQTLTYQITILPNATTFGKVYLADGTTQVTLNSFYTLAEIRGLQFQPAADKTGTTGFAFNVADSGGTANGGLDYIQEFMLITITPVNDVPVITTTVGNARLHRKRSGHGDRSRPDRQRCGQYQPDRGHGDDLRQLRQRPGRAGLHQSIGHHRKLECGDRHVDFERHHDEG